MLVHCVYHNLLDRVRACLGNAVSSLVSQMGKPWLCSLEGSPLFIAFLHLSEMDIGAYAVSGICTSLELITFWCKFWGPVPGNCLTSRVITGCCQPSLCFLGWNKFLKNLEGFLSICLLSIPWAGNQSQSSCLAITESGNFCLLATGFCALPCKDDQGWALGQNSTIYDCPGACEAASPRGLPAEILGIAWWTGKLQGSSLWVSVQDVQGVSWSAVAETEAAEAKRWWGHCSDQALE